MAVRPTAINPDGTIAVVHDEAGHTGTLTFAQVGFPRRPDGTPDYRLAALPCPGPNCGARSVYPITGGSDAALVQFMFAKALRYTTDPRRPPAAKTWDEAKARVKALVVAQEGPDRWRLEGVPEAGPGPEAGPPVAPVAPVVTRRGGDG